MPGVVSVQPRVGSTLGQVAQVAQTAKNIYDIKHESDMEDLAQAQGDRQQQAFDERDAATAKELPFILKNARTVSADTPGAIEVPRVNNDSIYILPKKEQDYQPINDYISGQGQHGTVFIDRNDPTAAPVGFAQTAKPQREPREPTPHFGTTTDSNGVLYKVNTLTGDVTPISGLDDAGKFGKAAKPVDPDKQAKTYTEMVNKLATPGKNQNVQQALVNLRNIKSAEDLINQYPDLNKMPPNDYGLLVTEIGKIAHGGVASEHTQNTIAASTIKSQWDGFMQKVGGQPTGADLGAFIEQNKRYLQNLKAINQGEYNNYANTVYNAYKSRLTPEQDAMFRHDFADVFKGQPGQPQGQTNAPVAQQPQGGPGTAIAAPSAPAGPSTMDIEAELARRGIKVGDTPDRPQARSGPGGL